MIAGRFKRWLEGALNLEENFLERDNRRKGLALEALRLILQYATSSSPITSTSVSPDPSAGTLLPVSPVSLVVRIGASNKPSISLFSRLGFTISKHVEVFDEVEMKFAYDREKGEHLPAEQVDALAKSWKESPMKEIDYP